MLSVRPVREYVCHHAIQCNLDVVAETKWQKARLKVIPRCRQRSLDLGVCWRKSDDWIFLVFPIGNGLVVHIDTKWPNTAKGKFTWWPWTCMCNRNALDHGMLLGMEFLDDFTGSPYLMLTALGLKTFAFENWTDFYLILLLMILNLYILSSLVQLMAWHLWCQAISYTSDDVDVTTGMAGSLDLYSLSRCTS